MSAVARLGDTSNHGGTITTASSTVKVNGIGAAMHGDMHSCPISGHGVTPLTKISTKTKLITVGATAGCGAVINVGSPDVNAA